MIYRRRIMHSRDGRWHWILHRFVSTVSTGWKTDSYSPPRSVWISICTVNFERYRQIILFNEWLYNTILPRLMASRFGHLSRHMPLGDWQIPSLSSNYYHDMLLMVNFTPFGLFRHFEGQLSLATSHQKLIITLTFDRMADLQERRSISSPCLSHYYVRGFNYAAFGFM